MSSVTFDISVINNDFFVVQNNVDFDVQNTTIELEVTPMGARGLKGDKGDTGLPSNEIEYTAAEAINSHMPIALVDGLAYKMDYLNPLHQFAFIGFSRTSAVQGGLLTVETRIIQLAGWNLQPHQTYLVGANGGLITINTTPNSFSKIVGVAQSTTSLLVVNSYTSINKN